MLQSLKFVYIHTITVNWSKTPKVTPCGDSRNEGHTTAHKPFSLFGSLEKHCRGQITISHRNYVRPLSSRNATGEKERNSFVFFFVYSPALGPLRPLAFELVVFTKAAGCGVMYINKLISRVCGKLLGN